MKVIDLLNKMSNGEEVPKKIRLGDSPDIFYYLEDINSYRTENNEYFISEWLCNCQRLNYKVEIIEEDKKIEYKRIEYKRIETIPLLVEEDGYDMVLVENHTRRKINEIIDKINKGE